MAIIKEVKRPVPNLPEKKKVAAYARVSMDTDNLLHSLSAQVSHFSQKIQANPEWEYAGVYVDEAITGRKIAPRKEFQRLIDDCNAGKINLVLVKSMSRFARDTVDFLNTIRHLKSIGVEVRFERENISSFTADGELLVTLLASFAQAESESIAENVRLITRKKFAQGIPNGHKAPYGYRWDGEMFRIIPEEGKIVKQIYERYLSGEPAYSIAKDLKEKGITGQSGRAMCDSTIKDIVTSLSYTGTMILQKNYFSASHTRKKNKGELPMYIVEDMFEPLVSVEDYEKALAIRQKRADELPRANITKFSGIVRCGCCGSGISRRTAGGKKRWCCNTKERKGMSVCSSRPISEEELNDVAEQAVGRICDEDFRKAVACIIIYGDRIEFQLSNGRTKNILRHYSGKRGSNPYTNKVYCECCGKKCERNSVKGMKLWHCSFCKEKDLKETDLISASKSIFGDNYGGQIVEAVEKTMITSKTVKFIMKNGETRQWEKE